MKITRIETVRIAEFPNLLYVQIHIDEGIVGLGETFSGAAAVEAWIHETAAPLLMAEDPRDVDRLWHKLSPIIGFDGAGVENRGRSAIDIALWDIAGRAAGQPVWRMLGGMHRDCIPLYNTCAGSNYVRNVIGQEKDLTANWNCAAHHPGPYEDLDGFMQRPEELAQSLAGEQYVGMKVWPFDPYAVKHDGQYISAKDIRKGCETFAKIRDAVGDRLEIMAEMHSLWSYPAALRIAESLEEFTPLWMEDPMKMDEFGSLKTLAENTSIPLAASENLATRGQFKRLLESEAVGYVHVDPVYAGGISEARRIAGMAETVHRPVLFHDCTGPLSFAVDVTLSCCVSNVFMQEFVRAYYFSWYREILTELPRVKDGRGYPVDAPGLGTALNPEICKREDACVKRTPSLLS